MRERINKIIKEIFDLNDIPDNFSETTYVFWDSMHHLQLMVALEIEFNISFEPDDIAEMKSIDSIEKKISTLFEK